jgi:hypothetical protein
MASMPACGPRDPRSPADITGGIKSSGYLVYKSPGCDAIIFLLDLDYDFRQKMVTTNNIQKIVQ